MKIKDLVPFIGTLFLCALMVQGALAVAVGDGADAENITITILPALAEVGPGETADYDLVLDYLPAGIAGYNISVGLTDGSVGEIVAVTFPLWAGLKSNGTLPADEVWCTAVDLAGGAGTENITLMTLTLRGDAAGSTGVVVLEGVVEDRNGGLPSLLDVAPATFAVGEAVNGAVNFTADVTWGTAPLTVQFTDTSTVEDVTSWFWDFGDGFMSTRQHPLYTFHDTGSFTVTLTLTDARNVTWTEAKEGFITILDGTVREADFIANVTEGPAPLAVQFTDTGTIENVTAWSWEFGDGGTSDEQNPVWVYMAPGRYNVSLMVTDVWNATFWEEKPGYITVNASEEYADFTANVTAGEAPLTVQFTDTSTVRNITSWFWEFGDGNTSEEQHPVHIYAANGTYDVGLTINREWDSYYEARSGYIMVGMG
ncbi:PKD domain-containing protein [Methanofollis tationis]|uniref:PKD domain-containing protein n=1 Tax=Methanofollis tationis TaxID=81417 RepID=A0A7K4HN78_9EURY|nr:PKD domain-containing protein [Methanofollis tationis]NVO66308.1 PKD domain-containing protein [Methanofollis tationis]